MHKKNIFLRFKSFFILFFLLLLFSIICAFSYINTVSAHISDGIFRLHILANSNSSEDQELKLLVRDNVITYLNSLVACHDSKQAVTQLAKEHINDFKHIAESTIKENGYDYDVDIEIGNFEFPTKDYGDISLPAGFYDAMRIKIGKSEGQNWWCVMFPPLCFIDVSSGVVPEESKKILQNEFSEEEYYLISKNTPEIKFKFKLLELFSSMANTLTAKKEP